MPKQNANITIVCSSIDGIRVNPTGFYTTIEVQLNDADINGILDQINCETIKNYLAELDQTPFVEELPERKTA